MVTETDFLADIHAFLGETGMKPSYFGKAACGNSELVARLKAGKTVTLETVQKCQTFMATRRATQPERAA